MGRSKKSRVEAEPPAEAGHSREEADKWQYGIIRSYGFAVDDHEGFLTKHKAFKLAAMLRAGKPFEDIAKVCAVNRWHREGPSGSQIGLMKYKGLPHKRATCRRDAGIILDAALDPVKCYKTLVKAIDKATSNDELTACAREVALTAGVLSAEVYAALVEVGRIRRQEVEGGIPE